MEIVHNTNKIEIDSIIQDVIAAHRADRSELVSMLKKINDRVGHLPTEAFVEIAKSLDMPVGEVYSVASFYTMLLMEPRGRHLVLFCESAPCHLVGARQLEKPVVNELGIQPGETSKDGRWTLLKTSCLGQCARGPVLMIDEDIYGPVTSEMLPEIFRKYD